MKWVAIISLVFQYLAFWFAAPELLGSTTLKRFENGLKKLISSLPLISLLLLMTIYAAYVLIYGLGGILLAQEGKIEESDIYQYYIILAIITLVYMTFIFTYKSVSKWMLNRISEPLIQRLIDNNESRRNALIVGAILFTLGFLMQVLSVVFS